jgi:hypothetical protein
MVAKKSSAKRKTGKLKVKKETLRDLNAKGKGKNVRGGVRVATNSCEILCTMGCTPPTATIRRG